MANGSLRCIGKPLYLKRKFGNLITLQVLFANEDDNESHDETYDERLRDQIVKRERVEQFISDKIPQAKLTSKTHGQNIYTIDRDNIVVSNLFKIMTSNEAADNGVHDWGISQTSLEEVFVNIAKKAEAEAEAMKLQT